MSAEYQQGGPGLCVDGTPHVHATVVGPLARESFEPYVPDWAVPLARLP